tara:strand:- start:258 stop:680 length:423 start_codon:yes stop_codon:yes gene_type:complete
MANEIKTMRAGIKALLSASGTPLEETYEYEPETLANEPAAVIALESIDYAQTLSDTYFEATFRITAYVSTGRREDASDKIDDMLSPVGTDSLVVLITADKTLSASADSCRIDSVGNQQSIEHDGQWFLTADIVLTAWKSS